MRRERPGGGGVAPLLGSRKGHGGDSAFTSAFQKARRPEALCVSLLNFLRDAKRLGARPLPANRRLAAIRRLGASRPPCIRHRLPLSCCGNSQDCSMTTLSDFTLPLLDGTPKAPRRFCRQGRPHRQCRQSKCGLTPQYAGPRSALAHLCATRASSSSASPATSSATRNRAAPPKSPSSARSPMT